MSESNRLKKQLEAAELEINYLKRRISQMEKRLLRQEKLDDMNRHQTKWAMQQLEQARKLAEQASQAKTDFLATMSHEIRTPLNIVLGMGELLAHTGLDQNQSQYLQSLRFSGEHLLKLINDILEFSRIESGSVEVLQAPFDIKELLTGVEAMGTHLALEKGVKFSLDYDQSAEINRLGDYRKIKQVLINLVGNAVKYTDSGLVRLSAESSGADDPEEISFIISDTGIGIPDDKQALIFERFTQIEQGDVQEKGGVGLGLAISKRLVVAMGGQIQIDSEVGRGSVFTVQLSLPFADRAPLPSADSLEVGSTGPILSPLKLLVVDDIYLNFEVIKNYLKDLPVNVSYAENGRQAQKLFLDDTYDVILMDLRMPVMGGVEAVTHIRKLEQRLGVEPTPIIAMTAHAFIEQEKTYLNSGFDEVLIKPFSRQDLLITLKRHSNQAPAGPAQTGDSSEPQAADKETMLTPLIPQVLDSIAADIKTIQKALHDNDHQTLEKTSHALKGLAGFYGFNRLANLLELLEESTSKREHRTARALVVAIGSHVEELRRGEGSPVNDVAN